MRTEADLFDLTLERLLPIRSVVRDQDTGLPKTRPEDGRGEGRLPLRQPDGRAEQERRAGSWRSWRRPRSGRWRRSWWRCRSGTSARPRPGRWPPRCGSIDADHRTPRRRSWPRSRASARGSRPRSRSGSRSTGTARSSPAGGAAGVRMGDEAPVGASRWPQTLDGLTFVVTGTLADFTRDEAGRGADQPGRQGLGLGVEEDLVRGGGGERRVEVRQGGQLGVPILDEAGLRVLLDEGPEAAAEAGGNPGGVSCQAGGDVPGRFLDSGRSGAHVAFTKSYTGWYVRKAT